MNNNHDKYIFRDKIMNTNEWQASSLTWISYYSEFIMSQSIQVNMITKHWSMWWIEGRQLPWMKNFHPKILSSIHQKVLSPGRKKVFSLIVCWWVKATFALEETSQVKKKITLRGNFHFANFDSMVNLSKIPII